MQPRNTENAWALVSKNDGRIIVWSIRSEYEDCINAVRNVVSDQFLHDIIGEQNEYIKRISIGVM